MQPAIDAFKGILEITPGDRPLREAFIDLLTNLERHPLALAQLDALAQATSTVLKMRGWDETFNATFDEKAIARIRSFHDRQGRGGSDD